MALSPAELRGNFTLLATSLEWVQSLLVAEDTVVPSQVVERLEHLA